MRGPVEYLTEHRSQVLSALDIRDLTPQVFYSSAEQMDEVETDSTQLVVTSPPYPMIEMWDHLFEGILNIPTGSFAHQTNAFELSHQFLDRVWSECYRVLDKG